MKIYSINENGTVADGRGKVIFWGLNDFISDICSSENCFICGAHKENKEFNNEHIIPQWILREFNLFNDMITLANGTRIQYKEYTVPCCRECNEYYGKNIEIRVKEILNSGYNEAINYINNNSPWLFITWLALIFFKTHYKDKYLKFYRDNRIDDKKSISSIFSWDELHHVYCIARAPYSKPIIYKSALSSFLIFPIEGKNDKEFDYLDSYDAMGAMVRYHNIGIIALFDDGCAAHTVCSEMIQKIKFPVNQIQAREIFLHMMYVGVKLIDKPDFYSHINIKTGRYSITARRKKKFRLGDFDNQEYGTYMYFFLKDMLKKYMKEEEKELKEKILFGNISFLVDKEGNSVFINKDKTNLTTASS